MADDLREKIAEVLAVHRLGVTNLHCRCGRTFDYTGTVADVHDEYRRHVAEAILAAIGGEVETLTCHLCDWPRPIDLDRHWHAVHLAKPEES